MISSTCGIVRVGRLHGIAEGIASIDEDGDEVLTDGSEVRDDGEHARGASHGARQHLVSPELDLTLRYLRP